MARPVDMTWAIEQAKKKKLHVHGGVKWKDAWYIIWKDDRGPVYSSLANIGLIRKLGGHDWIHLDDGADTITHRVMNCTDGTLG